jgi:hypothetical protein
MPPHARTRRTKALGAALLGALVACAGAAVLGSALPAAAQGWWPWANSDTAPQPPPRRAPVPQEPVYRGAPPAPIPGPQPGGQAAGKAPICLELEQRLVLERQKGSSSRDSLPKLEADIRQLDRAIQADQSRLERADCYDYFLFSKTLRRTRQCVELSGQIEASKRRMADLDIQRQQLLGSRGRGSFEDDIIRDLARNNCGAIYTQEAQRRGPSSPFSSLWQDEDAPQAGRGSEFGSLPFATYRTICVRLCDGYFFPVSFSTLQTHFERDADACQSKCAAPAELYYHQNPGGTVEQAVSVRAQTPYTSLKTAFRYRKEFVQGCSCKQAEYTPSPNDRGDRKADAPAQSSPSGRQAQR